MPQEFNADEIFALAEKMEKNGAAYYRKAAGFLEEDDPSRRLLLGLADMEDRHLKTFIKMREEMSGSAWRAAEMGIEDEATLYLQAYVDGKVFNPEEDAAAELSESTSLEEILKMAIKMEQDSILFYLGMRDMVPENMGRDRVDAIINEEKSHVVGLSRDLEAVKKHS